MPHFAEAMLLFIIFLFCAVLLIANLRTSTRIFGGDSQPKPKKEHLVVDTLNFTHWMYGTVSIDTVIKVIDMSAPILRSRYMGEIFYVVKDKETCMLSEENEKKFKDAATRNLVHICIAEKYVDPPAHTINHSHTTKGRDDFFMCVLANRYKCAVLTTDSLKDIDKFRTDTPPFFVIEFTHYKSAPDRHPIRPDILKIWKPRRISFDKFFDSEIQ